MNELMWETYKEVGSKDAVYDEMVRQGFDYSRAQVREVLSGNPPEGVAQAEILYLDIETAPNVATVWSFWKQNIGFNQILEDWYMLTWAGAWGDGEVFSDSLIHHPTWEQDVSDDGRLLHNLWHQLDRADIVIAHNGDKFDLPRMNARFLVHGLPPPSPYQTIDTLKVLKRKFQFGSNSLAYVTRVLGIPTKTDPGGMETWVKCIQGDVEAMRTMESYNKDDIVSLRALYKELQAWVPSHPNMGIITQQAHVCPACGGKHLTKDGTYRTPAGEYPVWRCEDCGAQSRERKTTIPTDVRAGLLVPLAR